MWWHNTKAGFIKILKILPVHFGKLKYFFQVPNELMDFLFVLALGDVQENAILL